MMHFIEPTWGREDIIARDEDTGAYLCKSRAQYALVVPEQNTRHWSRRKITNDADALAKAKAVQSKMEKAGKL